MRIVLGFLTFFFIVAAFDLWADEGVTDISEDLSYGNAKSVTQGDVRALKAELMIQKSEKEALNQVNKLIRRYRGTGLEAGLWFRKAELFVRRAKSERFYEIHRESETIVNLVPKRVKRASSKKYLIKAIETYDSIQRRFKRFRDLDLVMFNNAFARQQIGQNRLAKNLYRQLLAEFPDSDIVPDTLLALGEMLYKERKYKTALVEYQKIKKYPNSRVYPYGVYKSAWAMYNLKRASDGLKELEHLLDYSKSLTQADNSINLREEALNDMVLFYSDVHKPENAYRYFAKFAGKEEAGQYVVKLAQLFDHHDRHEALESTLKEFISANPKSQERPTSHKMLAETYEKMRKRDLASQQVREMVEVCKDVNFKCVDRAKSTSKNFAAKWHKLWSKNRKARGVGVIAAASESAYESFLLLPIENEEDYKVQYSFAELLFQSKKYRKAVEHYFAVGSKAKNKKIVHDSSYSALFSLEKAVKDKWADEDELLFLKLARNYIKRNPRGKYLVDVRFKRAFIAYDKGRLDEASPELRSLGWEFPKTERGIRAQNLYLDILNIKKDYASLQKSTKELMRFHRKGDRNRNLKSIYEQAFFAEVQQMEESDNLVDAAKGYSKFASENPKSKLAGKARWNAIELYYKTGNEKSGADLSLQYAKLYPNNKNSLFALQRAAKSYEDIVDFKGAIEAIDALVKIDAGNAIKWNMLAAQFYLIEGNYKKAEANAKLALEAGTPQQALRAAELIYDSQEDRGSNKKQIEKLILMRGYSPYSSKILALRAMKQWKSGDAPSAFKTAGYALKMKTSDENRKYKAQARLVQAQILKEEFDRQSVKSRPERLAAVLGIKTNKLDKAQRAFQSAISYGDPEVSVKSLIGLAECYQAYTKSLRTLELVGKLNKQDKKAIKSELENLALPMEDKYVESLSEAMKVAKKLNLRDGSIGVIQTMLDKVNLKKVAHPNYVIHRPGLMLPKERAL